MSNYVLILYNGFCLFLFIETGNYLALDLGGTNYRVLCVHLGGKGVAPIINERTYSIPIKKMTGSGLEVIFYYSCFNLKINFVIKLNSDIQLKNIYKTILLF